MLDFNIYLLLAACVCLLILLLNRLISRKFLLLCFVIFGISIIYVDSRKVNPDILSQKAPCKMTLTGRVVSEPKNNLKNRTKFYFQTDYGKTLVTIYDYKRKFEFIRPGDVLKLDGSVKKPYEIRNFGQFDYGKYLKNRGIFTLTYVNYNDYTLIESPESGKWFLIRKLNDLKNKIVATHAKYLKTPKLEVLGGMVFGDYAVPAPHEVEQNFIKSGLLHLLAASGMNVGIIFGVWYFIGTRLRIAYKPVIAAGMLLVAVYSLLTGLPPSVTRAALMMEFMLFGKLLDRNADSKVILALVCVLMLLFDPFMLSDVGFQLSFIATFGLLLCFSMPIIMIPVVAQLFVAPLQIFHFNNFASYSILANLLVIPFVGIISSAGFIGSILSVIPIIGEKLCFVADKIAEPFIFLLLYISEYTAGLPGALYYVAKPEILTILVFYTLLVAGIPAINRGFKSKALNITVLISLLLFMLILSGFPGKKLEIVFFDVGQGDAMFIKTPDNRHFMVDTGPRKRYSPIVPFLKSKGVNSLDAIVLTHSDIDHTGGTSDILENISAKTIYSNNIKDGDILNISNSVYIRAIRPKNTNLYDDNEDSIMLHLVYKDFSALLMADCEADALHNIKYAVKNPITILKVGHHGSKNAVNTELLKYLKPEISVISVGKGGYRWGHPDPTVISLLKAAGSRVYRTDRDFAVRVITNGRKTDIITVREGEKPWK